MEERNTPQNLEENHADIPTKKAGISTIKNWSTKKKLILGGILIIALVAIVVVVNMIRGSTFQRVVSKMLAEYPYANNAIAADGSYLKLDTNPYDKDVDELTYVQAHTFANNQKDTINGIKFVNKELGFTDALYSKMLETTALMGRQTEENDKYRVSWTYHPDKGLEVMYEKK